MAPSDHSLSLKSLPLRDNLNSGISSADSYPQPPATPKGITPLTSKVTSVLSTTHSDAEFRDALSLLDQRGIQNDAETRRRVRLDLQKEVIDSNGEVIAEFGRVAEVGFNILQKDLYQPANSNSGALKQLSTSSTMGMMK